MLPSLLRIHQQKLHECGCAVAGTVFCCRVWRSVDTWYHSCHSHNRMAKSLGMSQSLIPPLQITRPLRIIHVDTTEPMVQSSNYRKCVAICWASSPKELLAQPPVVACNAKLRLAVKSGCIFFAFFFQQTGLRCGMSR